MLDTDYRQIQNLAESACPPSDFVRAFVETFSRMSGAELGIAWNCESKPFKPICQVMREPDAMVKLPLSSQRHEEILNEAHTSRRAMIISPPTKVAEPMPTVLVAPVRRGTMNAVAEFVLPVGNTSEQNRAIHTALADCCRIVEEAESAGAALGHSPQNDANPENRIEPPGATHRDLNKGITEHGLSEYATVVHQSLDLNETANTIANEARRILDCDRVTVFEKQGRALRTLAISGQPIVNHRSNTVKALHRLVETVLKTENTFWYPNGDELPNQIQETLDEYIDLSLTRSVAILPIFDRVAGKDKEPEQPLPKPRMIGGLAIEQTNEQWERVKVEPKINKVVGHAGLAFRNAHEVSGMFLYPVWRALGKTKAVTTARGVKRILLAALAISALVLAMIFVPATFYLGCEGVLLPIQRQRIFADQVGTVSTIVVEHGAAVRQGERLLVLQNDELEIQIEQLTGELNTLRERLAGNRSIRITSDRQEEAGVSKAGQRELQSQISSLERRLKTLDAKKQRLNVCSPIDGHVLTWDLANVLKDRPVQQGDLLIEVANTKGEWELELDVADRKVGHLMRAVEAADSDGGMPKVRFTLAAEPQRSFVGRIRNVAHATSVSADRLQMVRVKVDVEEADLDQIKYVGSTVNAKIDCGSRSLGFVWLHDAWEFVQYQILFRIW